MKEERKLSTREIERLEKRDARMEIFTEARTSVIEDFCMKPFAEIVDRLSISPVEIERSYFQLLAQLSGKVVQILSKPWQNRSEGYRLVLSVHECEFMDFRIWKSVKRDAKDMRLSIEILSRIIDHFESDSSEWTLPD